jgi:predicted RNase H-like nuclease (RuvC/YqgF family)
MRTRLLAFALLAAVLATAVLAGSRRDAWAYIYKRNGSLSMSGNIEGVKALSGRYGDEFVWTRQGTTEYVITDRAVLDDVRGAFRELDSYEEPLRKLEERLRPHERELEKLETRLDAVSDQLDDEDLPESTRATLERQMEGLENEMHAIEQRMHGVEEEMDRLDDKMERIEDAAEEHFHKIVEQAIASGKAKRVD